MVPLLVAVSSLIGVLLGAGLQYFITLRTQEARIWNELRTKAYISYVENTAKLGVMEDPEGLTKARALRNSARFSIALFGTKTVVEKLGKFAPIEGERGSGKFEEYSVELFEAMRNELLPKDEIVTSGLLYPILFPGKVNISAPNKAVNVDP